MEAENGSRGAAADVSDRSALSLRGSKQSTLEAKIQWPIEQKPQLNLAGSALSV